jgi:ATP-dependent Clp endopeptidase proteolytic subunit ClpP
MKLPYRTIKNAEAIARICGKPLDKPDWYEIKAQDDESADVMIYDYIGWPFNDAGEFARAMAGLNQKTITVRINSPGGDVFDAMSIYNTLQSHKSRIITRNESLAASAASIIAMAGKEKQAYQNSMTMIHNAWAYTAGNQFELKEVSELLSKIDENMVDAYASNTNSGKREIRDMMKTTTWMTAKEAKEKGFVDTIVDGKSVKAQFDLSMFANVPDELRADKDHELTERDAEKALRDAGFSRNKAKAMLAGRLPVDAIGINEIAAQVKQITNLLKG